MLINNTSTLSTWKKNGGIKMKNKENLKVFSVVVLFFTTIVLVSLFLIKPTQPKKEEIYQSLKDSLSDLKIQKELDSSYILEHSKIK